VHFFIISPISFRAENNLDHNLFFLTKREFDEQVEIFKGLSLEKFYGILEYGEDDVEKWLVDYSIKNQDIEEALRNISIDLRDLEGELFNIKIQHEINVAPMRSYIEEWFKKVVDKLTNEGKRMVETIHVTTKESHKRHQRASEKWMRYHHSKFILIT
jgi:hypothetical protein